MKREHQSQKWRALSDMGFRACAAAWLRIEGTNWGVFLNGAITRPADRHKPYF
jgi:hypothetical protein